MSVLILKVETFGSRSTSANCYRNEDAQYKPVTWSSWTVDSLSFDFVEHCFSMFVRNFGECLAFDVVHTERLASVSTKHRDDQLSVAKQRNTLTFSMGYVRLINFFVVIFLNHWRTIGKPACVIRKSGEHSCNVNIATASVNTLRSSRPFLWNEKKSTGAHIIIIVFFSFFLDHFITVTTKTSRF